MDSAKIDLEGRVVFLETLVSSLLLRVVEVQPVPARLLVGVMLDTERSLVEGVVDERRPAALRHFARFSDQIRNISEDRGWTGD